MDVPRDDLAAPMTQVLDLILSNLGRQIPLLPYMIITTTTEIILTPVISQLAYNLFLFRDTMPLHLRHHTLTLNTIRT